MTYKGEVLHACGIVLFDFRSAFAVVVSGAAANPCGHMLLNTGDRLGYYCHVAGVNTYPHYLSERGYQRYLVDNEKTELRRTGVYLESPARAHAKLEELLSRTWAWWVLPHNCAAFVETVLQAGGTKAGLYSNCPAHERFR